MYLLQEKRDRVDELFELGEISLNNYLELDSYFERHKFLYTVNLN